MLSAVLAGATATGRPSPPGDGPGSVANRPARPSGEPIALTADRVRHWKDDGVRYVVLEGHAAAFLGDSGLRADRAVARVVSEPGPGGKTVHRVEVLAEGKARRTRDDGPPKGTLRETWTTDGPIDLSASSPQAMVALELAPVGVPWLSRALAALAPEPAERADVEPAPSPVAPVVDPAIVPASAEGPLPLPDEPAPTKEVGKAEEPLPLPDGPASANEGGKADTPEADPRPVRLKDSAYKPVQFIDGKGFDDTPPPGTRPAPPRPSGDDFGPSLAPPVVDVPAVPAPDPNAPIDAGTDLEPLPGRAAPLPGPPSPILPGTQRVTSVYARSGPDYSIQSFKAPNGDQIVVIRGGVNIVTDAPGLGTVDAEADSAILYRGKATAAPRAGPNGEVVENPADPFEVYLEGHVIFRQDRRIFQGNVDQSTVHADRAYFDYRADRLLGLDAQIDLFSPGLIAPLKVNSPRIDSFRPLVAGPNGGMIPSTFPEFRAQMTTSTGSRFARPGYRFNSRSVDIKKVVSNNLPPAGGGDAAEGDVRTTWQIDARQNVFYMGRVPIFYYPRFVTDADDLDPPLRQIAFRTNNIFGQQLLLDFNAFKLLGLRRPSFIDSWNFDVDYLSAREAVGLGTELGWNGRDPIRDIIDPYHKRRDIAPSIFTDYAGYYDVWGLRDRGIDNLGPGPAVVTAPGRGRDGLQRTGVPAFQDFRGRINIRHMQSFNTPESDPYEDTRVNVEFGYLSDRQFLEQYYKRLFDIGLDHEILLYGIRQRENRAVTVLAEANPNNFNTETQWLPKLDYYRLGDSLLGDRLTYFQHTGVNYANTHTANEVNNKDIFAFIPFDPVSNTSRTLKSGRAYTNHELDLPLNLGAARFVPYLQGQAVGWTEQINGQSLGRLWGAAGVRADIMAWRAYPDAESELLNVHGVNHKIDFIGDYRTAYSHTNLNSIGVQDDLDDNTYEFVRRYFALTNYAGGLLPVQYDPRFLLLRRAASPITGPTDIQASIQTLRLGIHQRLQTKRGPEGARRIIDYLIFDLDTTYFPNAKRDNFGKPFGQNTYNLEWYVGDRTSLVSYGWFEQFDIGGNPLFPPSKTNKTNPFGMNIITAGVNINRPPRGQVFVGYSIVDTGPIQTSALLANYNYWMSPKWYTTFGTSYDFGNDLLLGANGSLTRVGKDYFVSVGLNVNPLQKSYLFAFEIAPRLSPSLRLGSGSGLNQLDTRFAPTQ